MTITFREVIKQINSKKWWLEECPTSFFLFHYIMKTFVSARRLAARPTLQQALFISRNKIGMEITPYQEKKRNFLDLYQKELKRPGYFKKLFASWAKLRRQLINLNELAINKTKEYSSSELLKFAKRFLKLGFDSVVYGAFLECVDPFSEELIEDFKKKYNLSEEQAQSGISILAMQSQRSFLTQEKIDFYCVCLGSLSLSNYLRQYHWIHSNYKNSVEVSFKALEQKVKQALKNQGAAGIKVAIAKTLKNEKKLIAQKKILVKKLKLIPADKKLFKLLELFGYYIDLRKESMLRHTYARDKFLSLVEKQTGHALNDLRSMRDEEILKVLAGQKFNLKEIRLRQKSCAVYFTPKSERIFYGQAARQIYQAFTLSLESNTIKGMVASAPQSLVVGRVSLVIDVGRHHFKPGRILVTTMTRPEFMPLMRQAKAVITDEGGVICHAAIISRELKIPCLIGTKCATKILKNNDLVEMNLKTGQIRKLN